MPHCLCWPPNLLSQYTDDEDDDSEGDHHGKDSKDSKDSGKNGARCTLDINQTTCKSEYDAAWYNILDRFINSDDKFRDSRFKFIPRVIEGPWVVRKGVGEKPALLGKKVKQNYYRSVELNYLEVDVDLSSSSIAGSIFKLCKSFCKGIVLDMAFTIEGQEVDMLPERMIGAVRIMNCDTTKLVNWPDIVGTTA